MTDEPKTEYLFSYGTLRHEEVQLANFGRSLEGQPEVLIGYRVIPTQVQDADFARRNGATQRTLEFTGLASDSVAGMVFQITGAELERADKYEPTDYERQRIEMQSGVKAWVYLQRCENNLPKIR